MTIRRQQKMWLVFAAGLCLAAPPPPALSSPYHLPHTQPHKIAPKRPQLSSHATPTEPALPTPPSHVQWNSDAADVPAVSLAHTWPQGEVTAAATIDHASVTSGAARLLVTVRIVNHSPLAQRPLYSGLRLDASRRDYSAAFFATPISVLPSVLPPHGQAQQTFRVETFDDTPVGRYTVTPCIVVVPASADLLLDGGFENEAEPFPQGSDANPQPSGWFIPQGAPGNVQVAAVKAAGTLSSLSQQITDASDFPELVVDDKARIAAQGSRLLETAHNASGPLLSQAVKSLVPGQHYILGADSWNTDSSHGGSTRLRLDLSDANGKIISSCDRDFYPGCWRGRTITFQASAVTVAGRVTLISEAGMSWWDNAFLVPADAVRQADGRAAALTIHAAARAKDVAYLGDDTQTRGDWTGKYGRYAFILCGMSAPEDMVGGQVQPLKCDYADMQKVYSDETIRVSGKGVLRYSSWTGNPNDAEPRHWIDMPMRLGFDQTQALDNPQWGYRTSASWDDHGEMSAWGPDLFVRLRMPPGVWRVSFYFLDPNYAHTAHPRDYRLEFLDSQSQTVCSARVHPPEFGNGVYKVFQVRGGKDVVLRIRKDYSLNAILAGVFVDPLSPAHGPAPTLAGLPAPTTRRLTAAAAQWSASAKSVDGFADESKALSKYRDILVAALGSARARAVLAKLGDRWFSDGEYWRAALAYETMPPLAHASPTALASSDEARALQFRIVFSRYADRKIGEALNALAPVPEPGRTAQVRGLAARLFAVAIQDHTESHGLQRLPMILAKTAYDALEKEVGYDNLTATERAKKLAIAERLTWYTIGWDDVVAEAVRLWPTLTTAQKAELGPGFFADHVIHPMGILAQSDHAYVAKAAALVSDFVKSNPNTDAARFAQYELAAIYYQQGKSADARALCNSILADAPKSRPAFLCRSLLADLH